MKKTVLMLSLTLGLYAATTTDTTFDVETDAGNDSFGNALYERSVTIKTNNFKVDNFWDKFHKDGKGQSNFANVSKTGTVRISVEATSICTLHPELNPKACSGQKPFLLNNEAIDGVSIDDTITLLFQKDFEGSTLLYNESNGSVFYPLDVGKDTPSPEYDRTTDTNFMGFFSTLFTAFFTFDFSAFFNFAVEDDSAADMREVRQRYISNIVAGMEESTKIEEGTSIRPEKNVHNLVSLIDYSEISGTTGTCSLFFFTMPETSFFCNFPFISMFTQSNPGTNYVVDTIQADTENALISFASTYAEVNMDGYKSGSVDNTVDAQATGFSFPFLSMMKCFFFDCSDTTTLTEPIDNHFVFEEDKAINLTFGITNDGNAVDSFESFKLMGIHSMTGTEHMCTVKKTGIGGWTDTFKESQDDTDGKCFESSFFGCTTYYTPMEWLDWCDAQAGEAIDDGCTNAIECMFDMFTGFFSSDFKIVNQGYVNDAKRALLLDLKRIKLKTDDKANSFSYKLINTSN